MISDLEALRLTEVVHHGQHFLWRTDAPGACDTAFRAAGVATPPPVRSQRP
jgi:hypothetical protein